MGDDTSIGISDSDERIEFDGAGDISLLGCNVGIGTTAPAEELVVEKSANGADVQLLVSNSASAGSSDETVTIRASHAGTVGGKIVFARHSNYSTTGDKSSTMRFYTADDNSDQERMRIDKAGKVGIGLTPVYAFHINKDTAGDWLAVMVNGSATNPYGLALNFDSASNDNNSTKFFNCSDGTTTRLSIWDDGDIANHDNAYGAISDERIKQDIRDANSQWGDIKALKVRNFKRKDDIAQYGDDAWEQIGVIAQEVEESGMDKLVNHSPPSDFELEHCGFGDCVEAVLYVEGDELPEGKSIGDIKEEAKWVVKQDDDGKDMQVKSMKYSILYMKAVKALQEAMERIEGLESKVTALESA
jgi:hypothetical protein